MNRYGSKIRELREKNGDTLEELAAKMNLTFSALGKYERGERKITAEFLEEIAKIYDVPLSYFFGEEKEVDEELKKIDFKWIAFSKQMEERNITPEELEALLNLYKKINEK